MDRTTITLSRQTRDELASLGDKDDSFEDIVTDLLEMHGSAVVVGDSNE